MMVQLFRPGWPAPSQCLLAIAGKRARAAAREQRPRLGVSGLFATDFLAGTLACQGLFHARFLARLQVIGVTLHFPNDVFLLDLAFEAAQGIFQRLALLQSNFCQFIVSQLTLIGLLPAYRITARSHSSTKEMRTTRVPRSLKTVLHLCRSW